MSHEVVVFSGHWKLISVPKFLQSTRLYAPFDHVMMLWVIKDNCCGKALEARLQLNDMRDGGI